MAYMTMAYIVLPHVSAASAAPASLLALDSFRSFACAGACVQTCSRTCIWSSIVTRVDIPMSIHLSGHVRTGVYTLEHALQSAQCYVHI